MAVQEATMSVQQPFPDNQKSPVFYSDSTEVGDLRALRRAMIEARGLTSETEVILHNLARCFTFAYSTPSAGQRLAEAGKIHKALVSVGHALTRAKIGSLIDRRIRKD